MVLGCSGPREALFAFLSLLTAQWTHDSLMQMWTVAFEHNWRAEMWAAVDVRQPEQLFKWRRRCETHLSFCSRGSRIISCRCSRHMWDSAPRLFIRSSESKLSQRQMLFLHSRFIISPLFHKIIQHWKWESKWVNKWLTSPPHLPPGSSNPGLLAAVDQTCTSFWSNSNFFFFSFLPWLLQLFLFLDISCIKVCHAKTVSWTFLYPNRFIEIRIVGLWWSLFRSRSIWSVNLSKVIEEGAQTFTSWSLQSHPCKHQHWKFSSGWW